MEKNIFSFDAETNGLWGQAFAIGALVYDARGTELARFTGRMSDTVVKNQWVRQNVLPKIRGIPVTHWSYEALLKDFAQFYIRNGVNTDVITHVAFPVEVKILLDLHNRKMITDGQAPCPLLDVASHLKQAGEYPTSLGRYMRAYGLKVKVDAALAEGQHNPLYDAAAAAMVYRHLMSGVTELEL